MDKDKKVVKVRTVAEYRAMYGLTAKKSGSVKPERAGRELAKASIHLLKRALSK